MGELTLAGQKVAITGALTGPLRRMRRATAYALLVAAGATPARTVTGSTTLLVASRTDTVKHARALALGVPVTDSVQLARLLGYPPLW